MSQRRQEIIEAAIRCVGDHGLQKTNGHAVAKLLGIRPSNVTYHFPKATDLFEAMIAHIVEVNRSIVDPILKEAQDRRSEAQAYMMGNLRWVERHPNHYAVLLGGFMEATRSSDLWRLVRGAIEGGVERLYGIIARGIVEGEFVLNTDPKNAAESLHHLLVGTLTRYFTDRAEDTSQYAERMQHVTAMLLIDP